MVLLKIKSIMNNLGLIVALFLLVHTDAGQICMDCSRAPLPRDCDHVQVCGAHEVCVLKQIVSDSGVIYYDSGCIDSKHCFRKRALYDDVVEDETGDIVTCLSCCNGSYCNTHGCGSPPLSDLNSGQRGPICFSCPKGHVSPEHCDIVKQCGRDERCFVRSFVSVGGDLLYESGCTHSCPTVGTLLGRRDIHSYFGCCEGDYCNREFSTTINSTLQTPTKQAPTAGNAITQTSSLVYNHSSTSQGPKPPTASPAVTTLTPATHSTVKALTTTQQHTTAPDFDKEKVCQLFHYKYLKQFDHCVRIHDDVKLTWQESRQRCIHDGGDLLIFHNKDEELFFDTITEKATQDWDTKRYWIGASDLQQEGTWLWVDNNPVNGLYFHPNEPNDGRGAVHEDCGASLFENNKFLLNDDVCSNQYHFICEKNLNASHFFTNPLGGHCRNSQYIYESQHGICFKIYDTQSVTMADARRSCQAENADLIQFRNRDVEQFFLNYGYNQKENNNRRYWIGANKTSDEKFYWLNGQELQIGSYTFAPGEPNNYENHESCVDMTWFGGDSNPFAMNDDNCEHKYFFICEEKCPDQRYTFIPSLGICILVNTTQVTWHEAQEQCQRENTNLYQAQIARAALLDWLLITYNPAEYWVNDGRSSIGAVSGETNTRCPTITRSATNGTIGEHVHVNDCQRKLPFICEYIW